MGTLGEYLRSAREAKGIDLRDAAQQTRISFNYLKALEEEDFIKLPGEVFVKGFLKNYSKFLKLDEAETLRRYAEFKPVVQSPAAAPIPENNAPDPAEEPRSKTPLEPFIWGGAILIALLAFLFISMPGRHSGNVGLHEENHISSSLSTTVTGTSSPQAVNSGKIYLEIVALEDTWLLVRTDTSPQKKAVLTKGESLIWSADERFLLSYANAASVKLLLNGEELSVKGTRETPVRDLAVTRTGLVSQPAPIKQQAPTRPKPRPAAQPQAEGNQPVQGTQVNQTPAPAPAPAPAPVPAEQAPIVPQPAPPSAETPAPTPAQ